MLLTAPACSPWERVQHAPGRATGADLDHGRWSRDAAVQARLQTLARMQATLLSPAMQSDLQQILEREVPGRSARDILGFPLPQAGAAVLVVVAGHSRDWELLAGPRSPWSVELRQASGVMTPVEARRLQPGASFERFFPAWNPWSRVWLLQFELDPASLSDPTELVLLASGGLEARMRWP